MPARLTRRELVRGGAGALILAAAGTGGYLLSRGSPAHTLDRLRVDSRGTGFAGAASGRPFRAWGFNWGGPGAYGDLDAVRRNFSAMRSLGANCVRVHLQFADVMASPSETRASALDHIGEIVALAEREQVYLDISGNEVWLPHSAPAWYDSLSESARWGAQAVYWKAVARVCAQSPAVFCYDLLSEPIVGDGVAPGDWYTGFFGGFDFGQRISLQLGGRQPDAVAHAWAEQLRDAVRSEDPDHLITVGLLGNQATSGFDPGGIAPLLDFLAVHAYPHTGQQAASIDLVKQLAGYGKPVLVEETFTLYGDVPTLEAFILGTRPYADGWLGFYTGRTPAELARAHTIRAALEAQWIQLFRKYAPSLARTPPLV